MTAGAAQLAGGGPRPDQNQTDERKEPIMTSTITWPSRADLDAATARTAEAIEHGDPADIQEAAELEEEAYEAYSQRPGADAELQAEAEAELEAGG